MDGGAGRVARSGIAITVWGTYLTFEAVKGNMEPLPALFEPHANVGAMHLRSSPEKVRKGMLPCMSYRQATV